MSSTGSFDPIDPPLPDPSSEGGGLSDPNASHYRQRRQVLDIVNRLHSYGLQHQLDLPQIAVLGSQSVGKSSLIEAISGIKLPRASGTCTRCPIECRLSRVDEDWQCEVYLRLARQTQEVQFGDVITDKADVEDRIRRAQRAILNPSTSPTRFLQSNFLPEANENSFSKDLISVRISGRDVDDLSFVDLPGIIASVREGGREADIEEVKALVMSFIKKPSCLILLVISCETDLENQGARQLVKQVDPQKTRTIPVITKPDRIAVGEQGNWVKLLNNESERFKHGWHCVKQPDQDQIDNGISWEDARNKEGEFFESTPPWSSLERTVRSRLGTRPLTDALGSILYDLICKRLPGLLQEVEKKLQGVEERLKEMPQQIKGEPVAVVWKLIEGFKKDVDQLIAGRPEDGNTGLIQIFRASRHDFREAIFKQAPQFKPYKVDEKSRTYPLEPAVVPPVRVSWPKKPLAYPRQSIATPSKAYAYETFSSRDEAPEAELCEMEIPANEYVPVTPTSFTQTSERLEPSNARNIVHIDEVLSFAEGAITRELPMNYPYAVKKAYVARFTQDWSEPARDLFKRMDSAFLKELRQLVQLHFGLYSPGDLDNAIRRVVLKQLKESSEKAQSKIQECIAWEKEEPVTSNEHYLADYKEKFISRYKSLRRQHVQYSSTLQKLIDGEFRNSDNMKNALNSLHAMGIPASSEEDLLRILRNEAWAESMIEIMAEVRAYYQVAFKRFVDYVPMILDYELLKGFGRSLDLFTGLKLGGVSDRERCAEFLKEDPVTVRKRDALLQDLERFQNALIDLQNIPGISLSDNESTDGPDSDSGSQRSI